MTIHIRVNYIKSEYPLGTEDGINYNVFPMGHYE